MANLSRNLANYKELFVEIPQYKIAQVSAHRDERRFCAFWNENHVSIDVHIASVYSLSFSYLLFVQMMSN